MATLVIGSGGFIGSALLSLNSLTFDFVGIDKSELDLCTPDSVTSLRSYIQKNHIERIIVLASIKRQLGDSLEIKKLNNTIVDNIINAVVDLDVFVTYISSCAVYGERNSQINFTESSPVNPTSFYGEHKIESELKLKSSFDSRQLLILRPPLIYSIHNQEPYGPSRFLFSALSMQRIDLWGDGLEKREMINILDATTLITRLTRDDRHGTFNLVSGNSYSFSECANYLSNYLPNVTINHRQRDGASVDHTYNNCSFKCLVPDFTFSTPFAVISSYFHYLSL